MSSKPPLLKVTPAAIARIQSLISMREKKAQGIRIGLKSKGCTGLSYTLEYVDDPKPSDEVIESEGIRIYIDTKAVLYVIGTVMDYQDDKISSGFVFINPNEKGRCGCGESFHV